MRRARALGTIANERPAVNGRLRGSRNAGRGRTTFTAMTASVAIEERKKLLSDVWLFHGASDEELTALAGLAYEVTIGPHVDIVKENEFGDELFLVVDGHAAVTRGGVDLSVLNAGDFFGEMALLGTGVRTSTVRSIVAMTLLGLRAEHFDDLLASDPAVARRVLSVVVRRLERTDSRLAELEGRSPSG
jgi:CRP-like cAMP-binding protein